MCCIMVINYTVGSEEGMGQSSIVSKRIPYYPGKLLKRTPFPCIIKEAPNPYVPHSKGDIVRTDHDRLYKELFQTFFADFVQLFFPEAYEAIDFGNVKFLTQDIF